MITKSFWTGLVPFLALTAVALLLLPSGSNPQVSAGLRAEAAGAVLGA
jgi:hypothetical protein